MEGGLDIFQILLESGIVVKLVLLLLIASSILSWAIIIQKRKQYNKSLQEDNEFHRSFLESQNLMDLFEKASSYQESSLSKMYRTGYLELSKIKEKHEEAGMSESYTEYIEKHGITALERALKQGSNISTENLETRLSMLASIGSITPFVGLFGTVWGIIDSFAGLASGGGSIEAVAPGIAEALVATAVGLAAAIPAVWGYNIFTSKLTTVQSRMENFGQDFLNLIERSLFINKES